jgi:putative endonuclease|tara:strand:- start:132 stop:542 length:411 start_codon:yes stop_codon:yes gene_type:complete
MSLLDYFQRPLQRHISYWKKGQQAPANKGQWAEEQAENYLCRQGLLICTRNYGIKSGEIDLIALDREQLVFVEVRYRHSDMFGTAAESVTTHKQQKLRRAALHYLQKHKLSEQCPCRFDIVAMSAGNRIDWIKNAF